MLMYHILTENEKKLVCEWKYEGEYAVYNLPSYEVMKIKCIGFMNPNNSSNYYSFYDEELFVGFVNIKEEETEVFIGIGVNPSYCNQKYGQRILEEAYCISKEKYPLKPLYLEVRTWNMRAVNCYKKAGFEIVGESFTMETLIGTGTFYRMIRK